MELFREQGYDNVTVDQIVKRAGVAKGTFYIYYKTKSDIIFSMLRQYDDYYDKVMETLDPELKTTEKLREIVRSSCRFTENVIGLDLIRVLYTQYISSEKGSRGQLNEDRALYRIMSDLIRKGQAEGVCRSDVGPEKTALILLRLIRSVFFEWCSTDGGYNLEKECLAVFDTFCMGIYKS